MQKILLRIPDEAYNAIGTITTLGEMGSISVDTQRCAFTGIQNGLVLNEMTNGEVIQALFPEAEIEINGFIVEVQLNAFGFNVEKTWWDAKYGEPYDEEA